MNATQRAILGIGLLIALVLVLLPPWQSTIYTQDKQTRAAGHRPDARAPLYGLPVPAAERELSGPRQQPGDVDRLECELVAAGGAAAGGRAGLCRADRADVPCGASGRSERGREARGSQGGVSLGSEGLAGRVGGIVERPGRS